MRAKQRAVARAFIFSCCLLGVVRAQVPLAGVGTQLQLNGSDLAVLEAQEVRKDLACSVEPVKPVLGFDLRFHGGYDINLPLRDVAGNENLLSVLVRVTPDSRKDNPAYFVQRINVPKLPDDAKGEAVLGGLFDLGEGKYHIDLLMKDRSERVCSFYWDAEAALADRDKEIRPDIAAGAVERAEYEQFNEEPPVERTSDKPLNIKILVNFAPQNSSLSSLRPIDTLALVTVLRRLSREPQFGKFSVVAFNVQEQRVLYRQSSAERIDFPALGRAIQGVEPGKVDLKQLSQKHGEVSFLSDLIKKEIANGHPDALIFVGPKVLLDDSVPEEDLKPLASDVTYPVFYMNYNLNPQAVPWKDAIGKAIRNFRGTEFSISRPRDLWFAVSEVVSRIVKSNQGGNAVVPAHQGQ
ncbi:MAG TPA: acetyltransferase [Bryobacteraceae bacterium]|nr:acetyltransferase [Bryobacteraceae bacterium]